MRANIELLSPIQRRIRTELLGLDSATVARPVFPESLADRLRAEIDHGLAPVASLVGDAGVLGNKFVLNQIHQCEGFYAASEAEPFDWSIPKLRGQVAHKAIELAIMAGVNAPPALTLVEHALERMISDETRAGQFLKSLSVLELAQLKGESNDAVVKFLSDWPPIERSWFPRVESRVTVDVCGGSVVLSAKYDLAFGRPRGAEARVIIVDFKTGAEYARYWDDLRFYALVETLRNGVPPFRIATYYLEAGRFAVETVTEDLLATAARRTVDGLKAIIAVRGGSRDPALRAGSWCRFCPINNGCAVGIEYLSASREDSS